MLERCDIGVNKKIDLIVNFLANLKCGIEFIILFLKMDQMTVSGFWR